MATEPDREQASWLAFLLALVGPDAPERPGRDRRRRAALRGRRACPTCRRAQARAVAAYRQWAQRAGSQAAGFTGEADWSPQRRFARVFERLALPGMSRAARFELLATLGAAGLYELEPDQLQLGVEDDATTQAAKRILLSGDKMLLERRARDLAARLRRPARRARPRVRAVGRPRRGRSSPPTSSPPRCGPPSRCGERRCAPGRGPAANGVLLLVARLLARSPRSRTCCPPGRRTTRGRGSAGAARSPSGTSTRAPGPSWKPLPVLFTTPFALAGDSAAPELWLIVAQAGGLLAFAFTYRLAARLAGWPAGVIAAAGLVLADEFIRNFARGNSEGLLVGLCLWAIERHLDGHRREAFLLGVAAGLLRPELWPFLLLYGLWLMWTEPPHAAARGRLRRADAGRCGSCPSTSAPATSCAPRRGRASRTRTRPRSPTSRSLETFRALRARC